MMHGMISALFWLSALGLFYIYAGYPLWVWMRARVAPKPVRKAPCRMSVSVLISVYGEADKLERKLRSLVDADDAACIREVLVGSDGSPDDVAAAVNRVGDPRIRAVLFADRRGKPGVLNDLMTLASGEIVVFTDARQLVSRGALTALLQNFSDPDVGVVSGELIFLSDVADTTTAVGIGAYWRYEKLIRKSEAAFGSVPGATGALYAIRRTLLAPLPPETILDDVAIPMHAICRGFRCVFEPAAEVYDVPSSNPRRESIRKRRTLAGNVQLVQLWPSLLHPGRNPAWFAFLSHKLARLVSPFLFLATLGAGFALRSSPGYAALFFLQIALCVLAAAGYALNRFNLTHVLFSVPMMFISLNASVLAAWWDVIRGRYNVRWAR